MVLQTQCTKTLGGDDLDVRYGEQTMAVVLVGGRRRLTSSARRKVRLMSPWLCLRRSFYSSVLLVACDLTGSCMKKKMIGV